VRFVRLSRLLNLLQQAIAARNIGKRNLGGLWYAMGNLGRLFTPRRSPVLPRGLEADAVFGVKDLRSGQVLFRVDARGTTRLAFLARAILAGDVAKALGGTQRHAEHKYTR